MKKKVLTLGLAMSLVASPFALAADAEQNEDITAQVVVEQENLDTTVTDDATNGAGENDSVDGEVEEENAVTDEATEEEATEEEATEEEATEEEATEEEAVEEGTASENTTVELADVEQSWAKEEIKALVEAEIISGFPDGTFKPAANMTRDQFAKVLALSLGLEENEAANPFTDAGWAAPYIGALVNAELTQGLSDSLYGSSANVTREQLAVFFVRALGFEEEVANLEVEELDFADRDQIAGYAQASVAFLTAIDFIKGIDKDGTFYFNPKGNAERQAVARLAYEFVINGEEYQEKGQALLDSLVAEEEEVVIEIIEVVEEDSAEATEEEVVTEEQVTEDEQANEEEATKENVDTEADSDVEADNTDEDNGENTEDADAETETEENPAE